jgi:Mn-dependent DtxR family transcriptional regulator
MDGNAFHTFGEYMRKEEHSLTASMEDYLEMIYRLSRNTGFTRITELSEALNVQPPSATKMVQKLGELNVLKYEKYGVIILEQQGEALGEALLRRHNIIEAFLKMLGVSEPLILSEVEKIEHTISADTIRCFEEFLNFSICNPDIVVRFSAFRNK